MEFWSAFWLVVLAITVAAFVPLAVVVGVRGGFDIAHLFRALKQARQEKKQP